MNERCTDCNKEMALPYDNGDGKNRCEACAVKKYQEHPLSVVKLRPDIIFHMIGAISN